MTVDAKSATDAETLAALQANLDAAVTDREFVGDWREPWPSIRVADLGEATTAVEVPGTKTKLRLEYSYSIIRVEAKNPYLGIDLVRLVTATSPGYAANFYCEC
ncbi:hypothetical protein [Gulosibacter molinativorax]|uniref:Uncharacterized protein n=1 Tax=Gulosibacter molinativorax TaxID=256821 RepID=A0ABT7C891_9MICO|nr:hypothetical protein [Gulosibacter molinativorax]MDJ1371425.1 hypothetical protein [Gulosibacter molinativorax]QUY62923.1 Hypotetical protein [Gulosibacter molinativorax]